MVRFVIAPIIPVAFLLAAFVWGGVWSLAALIAMTLMVTGFDSVPEPDRATASPALRRGLPQALATLHLVLLPVGLWSLSHVLSGAEAWMAGIALGLFMGQVSNSSAHELIHRPARGSRRLGIAVYVSLLFGHHASAHPKVHHVHVATPLDPNSAPRGMGFYRFWPRAWIGSFRAGLAAENRLRAGSSKPGLHPYVIYVLGALACLLLAVLIGGTRGFAIYLALAGYAQMQLILSDYVQHYGLRRAPVPTGGFEPVGPRHSWNAPHWYSAALMLNAPHHSAHHGHPAQPFDALNSDEQAVPQLPQSLPVMASIALIPPLWRRVMDGNLARWTALDPNPDTAPPALGSV